MAAEFQDAAYTRRGRATLARLSEILGLSAPVVLRHLAMLVEAGVVERIPIAQSRSIGYRVRPFLQCTWIDPVRGVVTHWESQGDFVWPFPLVSRVPDLPAQRTLLKLLVQAEVQGLLAAPTSLKKHSGRPLYPALFVYGSCARGDARADSDLDVVVSIGPAKAGISAKWKNLIAEANLWAERPLDVKVLSTSQLLEAPQGFRETLVTEGTTVFAPYPSDEFIEGIHMQRVLSAVPATRGDLPAGATR